VIDKYNELLLQQLLKDQVPQPVQALANALSGRLTRPQQSQYELLDTQLVAAKIYAECHCQKLKMGNIQWCPEVTRSINRILFWKGILRRTTGRFIGSSVLRSRAKAGGIQWSQEYFTLPVQEVEEKIRWAYKAFKVVKQTPDRRSTWIAGVLAAQAATSNRSKTSLWKQHNAAERIRRTARTVQALLAEEAPRKALSVVICPGPAGTRRECTEKQELEAACLAEAGRRFTQAQHTPFLTEPLLSIFGETGLKKRAFRQVLDGTFRVPDNCDRLTQRFLSAARRPPDVQEVAPRSTQEYLQGWRKARESTSSSMSGIHFGHYIAGTFNPEILIINRTMADIPMKTGYSPERWKHGLNVLLEKVPGDVNIKKLRIILLFEADFNANNKWIGRAVMRRAEDCALLAPEQYGSRNRKSAIIQCLNKCLFYDLLWFRRQPAALCSNDAKSCYNRITLLKEKKTSAFKVLSLEA